MSSLCSCPELWDTTISHSPRLSRLLAELTCRGPGTEPAIVISGSEGPHVPSSTCRALSGAGACPSQAATVSFVSLPDPLSRLSLAFLGSIRLTQIIQDNLPISRLLTLITSAESLLCGVTCLQAPGSRVWTSR